MTGTTTTVVLSIGGLAALGVLVRGFWLYRASLTWPTADGTITRLDVERQRTSRGHFFLATFSYDFRTPQGQLFHGTWSKNFSTEQEAREFAARELPIDKRVIVRFHPKNPATNDLELDSWTYTGDRPLDLGV
jgi:hypothetical protein